MSEQELFAVAGARSPEKKPSVPKRMHQKPPIHSVVLLSLIVLGCLAAPLLMTKDPAYLDLANSSQPPSRTFLFGTDTLGRDLFSCIWYGGRISLFIGFLATAISTGIAIVYGSISGIAPLWLDMLMMRMIEIFLSIPTLLLIIFIQSVLGKPNVLSISIVIGITSWCSIAQVVRTQVRQIRTSEYVIASKCMGGSFFHLLRCHLAPNFLSAILFMVVMNVRSAIAAESTLSFMGMGLGLEMISWGSMLSLAEKALMSKAWWIILIPGFFLILLLMSLTNIGNWMRKVSNRKQRNL